MTEPRPLGTDAARIPVLDGIRGLAVLMVLAYHTLFTNSEAIGAAWLNGTRSWLWAGVDLFFVLSGFLISGILLDTKTGPRYFRNFYLRRTLRIFPLYYGVLFGVLVILPLAFYLLGKARPEFLETVIPRQLWLWTYMQNWLQSTAEHTLPGFGHFWTLAIEEQFYMVWPLVVFALAPKRLLKFCLFAAVFGIVLRTVLYAGAFADEWAIRHMTITRVDSLLIGAALALLLRQALMRERLQKYAPLAFGITLTAFIAMCAAKATPLVETIGYTLSALAAASLIALNLKTPYLDRSFLRMLGKYSYGIYVFHLPIAVLVKNRLDAMFDSPAAGIPVALAAFAITMVSSVAIAMVSWRLWEAPWLSLKDRIAGYSNEPRREKAPVLATAETTAP